MGESQHEVVRREFRQQAARFDGPGLTLSNQDYLAWMVDQLDLQSHFEVLDVAAGTGHLSRAIAPHVQRVVAIDLTPEMLAAGERAAEQAGLKNIMFEQGAAERLPYANAAFDLVVSRLSLHHFSDARGPLGEMVRVCRPGGRVAIIDLVSPEESTAASTYNHLERLRDPSHIRALTAEELLGLMREVGLDVIRALPRNVEVQPERWMDLTQASTAARQTILAELTQDLWGLKTTGMRPFTRQNELMFLQTWLIAVGVK